MTVDLRKHLSEIKAIVVDMEAALDRGENPTIFDANIIEYRAQQAAVMVRNAYIARLTEATERTPEEDRAAQRFIESGRDADGVTALLDGTAGPTNHDRDSRESAA